MVKMKENYGIYVHIPFCKARCSYCAFSSCTNFNLQSAYFDAVCTEISNAEIPDNARIATMYWGGGTPSSVNVGYLRKLYKTLSRKFDLSELCEFTVECNPESVTAKLLRFLRSVGVTRLSFGLQSANDTTLKKIGRIHTYAGFLSALNLARSFGFNNLNADVIVGLPETAQEFYRTVDTVVTLPISHVSLYALEVHENTPIAQLVQQYAFTDDDLADMYDFALAKFSQNGFRRYEVSNFAKKNCECKHNLCYWTEQRYFAFGAAASGFVGDIRYTNQFDVKKYTQTGGVNCRADVQQISQDDEMYEYVMLGLRLERGISLADFRCRFDTDFFLRFPNARKLIADGFLQLENNRLHVAPNKFYVLNSILTELL